MADGRLKLALPTRPPRVSTARSTQNPQRMRRLHSLLSTPETSILRPDRDIFLSHVFLSAKPKQENEGQEDIATAQFLYFRGKMSCRLIISSLLCLLLACFPANAGNRLRWWRTRLNQRFVTFDGNCARTDALDKRLRAIVERAIPADRRGQPGTWVDRAMSIRFRAGEAAVLFVLTTCGATGNCGWRLYDSMTYRYLGELGGQFIFVPKSSETWPMLVTYTHMSACDGILSRYEYRLGRYRWMKDDYAVSPCGLIVTPLPGKLGHAKKLCAKYGW
jgi:hypothetical protein